MKSCVKCGTCSTVCPVFQVTGRESLSARGKVHLLEKLEAGKASAALADILSKCLLCGACYRNCPRDVDTPSLIIEAREALPFRASGKTFSQFLVRKSLENPGILSKLTSAGGLFNTAMLRHLPEHSGLRLRLSIFDPASSSFDPAAPKIRETTSTSTEKTGASPTVGYFHGCAAKHLFPAIYTGTEKILKHAGHSGIHAPDEQICCGLAAFAAGKRREAESLARKNIEAFENNDLPILTSCASCYSHLSSYPDLLAGNRHWHAKALEFTGRLKEFSTFFLNHLDLRATGPVSNEKILYHDPCHFSQEEKFISAPRQLIRNTGLGHIVEMKAKASCCGHGGLFHLAQPEISSDVFSLLADNVTDSLAKTLTTTCSGCLIQFIYGKTLNKISAKVKHLAILLAENLQG